MLAEKSRIHADATVPKYIKRGGEDKPYPAFTPDTYNTEEDYGFDNRELVNEMDYFIRTYDIVPSSWDEMATIYSENIHKPGIDGIEAKYHLEKLRFFIDDELRYITILEKAAASGILEAQKDCIGWYSAHNNEKRMVYWISIAAENGDPESQMYVADRIFYGPYKKGLCDGRDAVIWYEKAAYEGNYEPAIIRLIDLYNDGIIVKRNATTVKRLEKMLEKR